jgi:porin
MLFLFWISLMRLRARHLYSFRMNSESLKKISLSIFLLVLLMAGPAGLLADAPECKPADSESCETSDDSASPLPLAGPDQVENRLNIDSNQVNPLFPSNFARGYFDWKDRISEENGVGFGGDYSFAYLKASDSPGEDDAFGGMYRLFGSWEASSDGKGNSGALIWKIEHRHAYGSNIPPGSLGFEVGYLGLFLPPFSDQGTRLTNLYWRQRMKGGNLVFVGGFVDVTDYVDVYMLASPWTGYFNFAFSTGSAAMPVPNEGLGMALGGHLNDNWYLIAGFADSNSDPAHPGDGFDTFFNEREYFKHAELGWNSTRETAFLNNVHLTLWHADEREAAATPDGWGANISFSRSLNEHWITFIRAGYARDAGSLLEKSLSTGFAYQTVSGGNQLGVAYNWGEPNESTWLPGLDDQHTLEAFYRIQLWKEFALTPDIQYIRNPALNPEDDELWVFGLRARLAF